jgi:hypothetical protein
LYAQFIMKTLFLKLTYVIFFELLCASYFAQQKDSSAPKTIEVKEELNVTKKRKFIYSVSNRFSDDEKYDVFKFTPSSQIPALIVIRGHLEVIGNPNEKRARINIYNVSNNVLIGTYNTNSYTGNYLLILSPNVKYLFKVEVIGYGTTQEIVEVPLKIDYEICQQDLKIKLNEKNKPVLVISSFFADENEKVFYIKTGIDTAQVNNDNSPLMYNEALNKPIASGYSSIDELVKKQLEEEKKKPEEALKAFKNNDFEKALSIYASLLKNDAGEPFVNYYYGICLLKLERNKAKAINSLKIASAFKDVPNDVFFYLGKACHLSYLFQDAIVALEEYKKKAKVSEVDANGVNQLIQYSKNGNMLMSDQVNIEIVKRSPMNADNILANYNPDLINEKVKYKTEFFNSSVDKKREEKLIVATANSREYIHVSYGDREPPNTDLYKNVMLPNGTLGTSQTLGIDINTAYDENYPYLTKDGNTLYFSSKGHNSIGGYDIFKCTRKDTLSGWSRPVNMGYPINSTYDDILFIPDEINQSASYCTNRKNSTYEYAQIKTPQHAVASSIIKGSFGTLDSIPKKEAFITVYNSNTGEIAGVYKTNPKTGLYLMILPSGTKYDVSIEAENYSEQTSSFEIPDKKGEFELKQIIKLQTISNQKTVKLTNYFTETEAAKISFEPIVTKDNSPTAGKDKQSDAATKKPAKLKKPRRTAEESAKDADDLKLALSLYDQATYQEASLVYENLNHVIDLSPIDSYYYGISLYNTKKDKTTCISALEDATESKTIPIPINVYYYLAKASQMSSRFSSAINYYKKFIALSKPEDIKKVNIDQEITYCKNGIKLVNNPAVLEVYSKKHVDQSAIQNSLMEIESGGKVLVITEDMRTSVDKKKNLKSLLFLSADKNTVLYSSYGENDANGKDIYQIKKMANGKWTPIPLNMSAVNSSLDEEYPSLSKDGKTLYFSSKGFENMGGYDIFKSDWDEKNQTWSPPVNLGAPINSPFDDFYFLE